MTNWLMVSSIHTTDIKPHFVGRIWHYEVIKNARLQSGDLLYLADGQSGLYGFGYVTGIEYLPSGSQREMMRVNVSRPVVQEGLVSIAEINRDHDLADIINQLEGNFVELIPVQANALNRMLRSRGVESPLPDNGTGIEVEDTESDQVITTPFDPRLIRVETKPLTVDLLRKRIEQGEIDLNPNFQRLAGIWTDAAQSRLIESLLIRIPLPAFYMDATDEEKWLVVDGLQRLTTLRRFIIEKQLRLHSLEFLTEYEGMRFDDLPRSLQRRIEETQITVYLIEKGTPPEVKFNIFKRINTGGLPLSSQEIRHALNQGKATDFLAELSQTTEFKQATDNGIKDERMADRECVLRFLAFILTSYAEYKVQDFDKFLNEAMVKLNQSNETTLTVLREQFLRSMKAAYEIFDKYAFRKRYKLEGNRSPINKPLFEAWSVNFCQLSDEKIQMLIERKDLLIGKFIVLMNDRDFDNAISQGTADVRKVRTRFEKIRDLIVEVLNDSHTTNE